MTVSPQRTILITGATGYIGRRLKDRLLERDDLRIRLLVRNPDKLRSGSTPKVEVVVGDTFNVESLRSALKGVDVAYYLIHSMGTGSDYAAKDRLSAENFRLACIDAGVRRIVYLGGLGEARTASAHLLSRLETGELLSSHADEIQTLWFRAGVIIGAGSASFEMIHDLTQRLPVMFTPKWVTTRTQPIAVDDVLAYLDAAIDVEVDGNLMVDIGTDATTFKGIMGQAASSMGLKRTIIPVPLFSPKISSYWLIFVTPVPFSIASALVEGLKSETVAQNDHASQYFSQITPLPLDKAFRVALKEVEHDQVLSRWCDSSSGETCDIQGKREIPRGVLRDRRSFSLDGIAESVVFEQICALGGEGGWDAYDPLWYVRGVVDKVFGGVGLNRGRRDQKQLRVGDAVDFWKVVDLQMNHRLLLSAQMKLPGKGWLEFVVDRGVLIQTAYFYPDGLLGQLYWWSVSPLHSLVFPRMGRKLIEKAKQSCSSSDQ